MDISKLTLTKKLQLAKNPNTPVGVLVELAKDGNPDVRWWVANNPNTSVEVLMVLAKDANSDVRYEVAYNPNTPIEILAELAKDDDSSVRYCVARNANSTVDVLAAILSVELRGDRDKDTLGFIFNHKNSTDTIKAIIKTVFPGVQ